jgi:AcrR family transcriptional regulator
MSRTVRKGDPVKPPGASPEAHSSSPVGNGSEWRVYAQDDLSLILAAALDCFMEHGYHGTTIRQVAARSGLSVPGLYHHYPSKHALLVAITSHAMSDLWMRSEQALAEAGDSVSDQFDSLVECLVLFHARRRELAFIAFSEIRSLDGSARSEHIAARDRQQGLLNAVVEQGAKTGVFATRFPREASMAVVTMCTGVAQWFRPEGAMTPEQLADRYREITRMAVGR